MDLPLTQDNIIHSTKDGGEPRFVVTFLLSSTENNFSIRCDAKINMTVKRKDKQN